MRSPIFEVGIAVSTLMLYFITNFESGSEMELKVLTFILGSAITGSTIIIAAIECDLGVYVREKYNKEALGTFSGMIDGFASVGSVLGQVIIAVIKKNDGWHATFTALTIFTAVSGIPTLFFIRFEYRQYRLRKNKI